MAQSLPRPRLPQGKTRQILTSFDVELSEQSRREVLTGIAGRAGVVAGVGGRSTCDNQPARPGLLLGQDADAAPLWIIDHPAALVPIDEGRRLRGLQGDAGQINVTATLHEQFRVAEDLRLRDCAGEMKKKTE